MVVYGMALSRRGFKDAVDAVCSAFVFFRVPDGQSSEFQAQGARYLQIIRTPRLYAAMQCEK